METYLEHERKNLQAKIKEYYLETKDIISEKMLKSPLRELTYEEKILIDPVTNGLVVYVDDYIHRYKIKLNKDITLEDVLKKII